MKNFVLIYFLISTFFVFSQTGYENYWKDLRSFDEHLENAKELKKYHTTDGYLEMAYLEVLKAIRFNPESSEAYSIKGEINYLREDYYGAMEDLNRSILLGSKNGCTYLSRALSRRERDYQVKNKSIINAKVCADLMTAKALGCINFFNRDLYLNSSFIRGNCE
jgi:tetratricopeptide (TPR) repeat protein